MAHDIGNMPAETLSQLSRDCADMVYQVCNRMNDDDLVANIRRLMKSPDLLDAFRQVQNENRSVANMTLNVSLWTLVNSQSIIAIDTELKRRAREQN
jgi:hypothetical protein